MDDSSVSRYEAGIPRSSLASPRTLSLFDLFSSVKWRPSFTSPLRQRRGEVAIFCGSCSQVIETDLFLFSSVWPYQLSSDSSDGCTVLLQREAVRCMAFLH